MNWLREFTTGFLIGLANLIPGVSGGTFALILGVYERLIGFLNNVNPASIITILRLLAAWLKSGLRPAQGRRLLDYLQEMDYPFMVIIGLGALTCIVAMSSVMKYLLLQHFAYTYAYFFGLIILSVSVPWRMIKKFRPILLLPILAGVILTVWVTAGVNPYEKARNKSELLKQQYHIQQQNSAADSTTTAVQKTGKFAYIGKYTTGEYLYIFVCGIIAISAMVLPGISGSLVLILMDQYFTVISAIANIRNLLLDDLVFLTSMAFGILIGLLSFARFIDFAFRKFHDTTVSFLVGLIFGSLYSLWPFKKAELIASYYVKEGTTIECIDNYLVYSNINILPTDLHTAMLAAAMVCVGMFNMLFFVRREKN